MTITLVRIGLSLNSVRTDFNACQPQFFQLNYCQYAVEGPIHHVHQVRILHGSQGTPFPVLPELRAERRNKVGFPESRKQEERMPVTDYGLDS